MTVRRASEPRPGSITALCNELGHVIAKAGAVPVREKQKKARATARCHNIGRLLLSKPAKCLDDMLT
jgi:hypothetical protein